MNRAVVTPQTFLINDPTDFLIIPPADCLDESPCSTPIVEQFTIEVLTGVPGTVTGLDRQNWTYVGIDWDYFVFLLLRYRNMPRIIHIYVAPL